MKNKMLSKKAIKAVSLSMATVFAASSVETAVYAQEEQPTNEVTEDAVEAIDEASDAIYAASNTIDSVESTETEQQLVDALKEDIQDAADAVNEITKAVDNATAEYQDVIDTEAAGSLVVDEADAETDAAAEDVVVIIEDAEQVENAAKVADEATTEDAAVEAIDSVEEKVEELDAKVTEAETELKNAEDKLEAAQDAVDEATKILAAAELNKNTTAEELEKAKQALADAQEEAAQLEQEAADALKNVKAEKLTVIASLQKELLAIEDKNSDEYQAKVKELGDEIVKYIALNKDANITELTENDTVSFISDYVWNKEKNTYEAVYADKSLSELFGDVSRVYVSEDEQGKKVYTYFLYTTDEDGNITVDEVKSVITDDGQTVTKDDAIITTYVDKDGKALENEQTAGSKVVVDKDAQTKIVTDTSDKNNVVAGDSKAYTYADKNTTYTENKATEKSTFTSSTYNYNVVDDTYNDSHAKVKDYDDEVGHGSDVKKLLEKYPDIAKNRIVVTRNGCFGLGWFGTTETVDSNDFLNEPDNFWDKVGRFFSDLWNDYDVVVTHTEETKSASAIVETKTADYEKKVVNTSSSSTHKLNDDGYDSKDEAESSAASALTNKKNDILKEQGHSNDAIGKALENGNTYTVTNGNTVTTYEWVVTTPKFDSYKDWSKFPRIQTKWEYFDGSVALKITTTTTTTENKVVSVTKYKATDYTKNDEKQTSANTQQVAMSTVANHYAPTEENLQKNANQLQKLADATKKKEDVDAVKEKVIAAANEVNEIKEKLADLDGMSVNAAKKKNDLEKKLKEAQEKYDDTFEEYTNAVKLADAAKQALAAASGNLSRFIAGPDGGYSNDDNNGTGNNGTGNNANGTVNSNNDDDDDNNVYYPVSADINTNTAMLDTTLMNIPAAQVPVAGGQATVGNARRAANNVANDTADTTENQQIADEQVPKAADESAKQDADENATQIKDVETPKAATENTSKPWWLLILAAIGLGGVGAAIYAKKKATVKADK